MNIFCSFPCFTLGKKKIMKSYVMTICPMESSLFQNNYFYPHEQPVDYIFKTVVCFALVEGCQHVFNSMLQCGTQSIDRVLFWGTCKDFSLSTSICKVRERGPGQKSQCPCFTLPTKVISVTSVAFPKLRSSICFRTLWIDLNLGTKLKTLGDSQTC